MLKAKVAVLCLMIILFPVSAATVNAYSPGADISDYIPKTVESPGLTADGELPDGISPDGTDKPEEKKFIKWAQFDVPADAMSKSYNYCIKAHEEGRDFDWIQLLTMLAVKYYGNWKSYKAKDLDNFADMMNGGGDISRYTADKNYSYYYEVYTAVLSGYVGNYQLTITDGEEVREVKKFGLKVYSPIADGYSYGHCDDFGNARGYGFKRKHLGHDMMGSIGTPIIAVESGYIEEMGWNRYGGWRIGIRSFDKKRYYYYAHLRKDRPFFAGLNKGDTVNAGDVIGYMGRTGYSTKENTNNIKTVHLHFGIQLIFDESQKDAVCELWIDAYQIVKFLQKNKSTVVYDSETKEYTRKYQYVDLDR